jgi:hypothetical protein
MSFLYGLVWGPRIWRQDDLKSHNKNKSLQIHNAEEVKIYGDFLEKEFLITLKITF